MQSYKFIVSGRVQGVYYRVNVAKNAKAAGFSGYVKNLANGSVEACVTCEKEQLESFKAILRKGSLLSEVSTIECASCDQHFSGDFEVKK